MAVEHEIELKLALPQEQLAQIIATAAGSSKKPVASKRLISTYYDTPRQLLRQRGVALRIRTGEGSFRQTVKAPVPGPGGLQSMAEYHHELPGPALDIDSIGEPTVRRLLKTGARARRLRALFRVIVLRQTVLVERAGTVFELCADTGTIETLASGERRTVPICELEFELVKGEAAVMLDAAIEIADRFDARLLHATKAARGYQLHTGQPPRLVKAGKLALAPTQTVREAFLAIMGNALSHLFANHELVQRGNPAAVHQTRVAMRRIRAALKAFKSVLPYDQRKAFNGEFRWFLQRFSPARDWHVFLDESLPRIAGDDDTQEMSRAIRRLGTIARRERAAGTAEVVELITSRRYNRLILRFQQWLCRADCLAPRADRKQGLGKFAARVLRKCSAEMLSDARPLARMSLDEVHTLRKRGKKMRYACEFFSALFPEPGASTYTAQLQDLQELLGELNDAGVARTNYAALKGVGGDDLMLVQRWAEAQLRTCISLAQPHWRTLQRTDVDWMSHHVAETLVSDETGQEKPLKKPKKSGKGKKKDGKGKKKSGKRKGKQSSDKSAATGKSVDRKSAKKRGKGSRNKHGKGAKSGK